MLAAVITALVTGLAGKDAGTALLLLPVLGVLLVTSEWSQRTALTTFALVPRRGRIITAKTLAGIVLSLN